MHAHTLLTLTRPALAPFAAMGVLWGCFAAVLPDLKAMLGVDEAVLGSLLIGTPLAAMLAMLAAPAAGAVLGRVALPVATLVMALAFALPGRADGLVIFALAMMFCGAATGLTDVLMNARVAAMENAHGLHLMNLCHAAYSFGYATGAIGTGFLREAGWRASAVMGALALLAALLALISAERDGRIEGLARPAAKAARRLGPVPVLAGGIVLIAFLSENAVESWSALHIEQNLGGSAAQGAMGPAVLALTMGISRLLGQGLTAHIGAFTLLRGGAGLAATGAVIAAMATTPLVAYAGFMIVGIGGSVIAPTAFSLAGQYAPEGARARAVARATLLGYCGYFIGPPLIGLIGGEYGLSTAFLAAASALAAILPLTALLARQRR